MTPPDDQDELERIRLNQETARIAWVELQRFFAQGRVIRVAPGLDLIEIARMIARDDTQSIAADMTRGNIAPVSDEEARRWFATQASLWAVVVKPWILVQE